MSSRTHHFLIHTLLLCLVFLVPVKAAEIDDYPRLAEFIAAMEKKHGFSQQALTRWFEKTEIRLDIIDVMNRPREASPWYKYREQFVTGPSARRGYRFWQKNRKAFKKATKKYRVEPEFIIAIIGVESQYGLNKGHYRVIDALTTLMLEHPTRYAYFGRELEQFLILARELERDPLSFKGSYAGAMGLPQFMPNSYRHYAVDFNKDGNLNLLTDSNDAIGSIANYLKIHGWKKGAPVVAEAKITGAVHKWFDNMTVKPTLNLAHFEDYGIFVKGEIDNSTPATLLKLQGKTGPVYRFGFNNFYVITRYNKSTNYAMAVTELARKIRERIDRVNDSAQ